MSRCQPSAEPMNQAPRPRPSCCQEFRQASTAPRRAQVAKPSAGFALQQVRAPDAAPGAAVREASAAALVAVAAKGIRARAPVAVQALAAQERAAASTRAVARLPDD